MTRTPAPYRVDPSRASRQGIRVAPVLVTRPAHRACGVLVSLIAPGNRRPTHARTPVVPAAGLPNGTSRPPRPLATIQYP